jgi:uncharacterized protein YcfJ
MHNKSILALVVALGLAACGDEDPAAGAGASLDGAPDTRPSSETQVAQASAGQNCYEVQVERPVDPRDDRKIAGTAIGAVVGGAIGNEINDSDFSTAAGAAAGAYAGRVAQDRFQENRTEVVTEVRCD